MAPGRWNQKGEEAIYTSTEIAVPVLERLVHTPKDLIPSNLALMKIQVSGTFNLSEGGVVDLGPGGGMWFYRSIAQAKERLEGKDSIQRLVFRPFAVAVPSVIVPAWNVVLFPEGRRFWDHVSLESVDAFEFDPRLFPEGTPAEVEKENIAS
jgi:RES domain-containing protein